jgi:2-polyprenyl-3-methyl-5-hydroxy-6-metoxy-1,4-benzoquinol methylase
MADTRQSYNIWAGQYDTNNNKTRDLEAKAIKEVLSAVKFRKCLEIGCGTGKNTAWLVEHAHTVLAVDLSEEMLAKARAKITSDKVEFKQVNILDEWNFTTEVYDLVTFSLVLEHIENLEPVFEKAANSLTHGGHVYIGELHPFKQYAGSKARFETEEGTHVVECFNHHISDFTNAGKKFGLATVGIKEYFDADRSELPRIFTLLLRKV